MKTYSNMRVPWHTHFYRAGLALFVKSDRPWHAYCYRGFESLKGNPKYSPPSPRDAPRSAPHELRLPQPTNEAAAVLFEIKRQRNRSNKTVVRHMENLTTPADCVQTSYGFEHATDSLQPVITERSGAIIVCTVALGSDYRKAVGSCLASHAAYCEKNGYSHAELNLIPNRPDRPSAWYKIPLGYRLLKLGYKYVFYADADCLITNQSFRLESLIETLEHPQPPRAMLITEDESGINSGCFLLQNTPAAARLLDSIWLYDAELFHPNWEQEALKRLIIDHEEVLAILNIEKNGKLFNSVPHERLEFHRSIVNPVNIWSRGDFICHFSGIRQPYLELLIAQYVEELKSP